jgi:hypothetical protein
VFNDAECEPGTHEFINATERVARISAVATAIESPVAVRICRAQRANDRVA